MRKIQAEHEIGLTQIERLPEWLELHPPAMESITEEGALVVIADALDVHGNDIIVALHLEKKYQGIEVEEVASVYGKRNLAYVIENTALLGRKLYPNERTGGWILRTGLQLPEQIASRLNCDDTTRQRTQTPIQSQADLMAALEEAAAPKAARKPRASRP